MKKMHYNRRDDIQSMKLNVQKAKSELSTIIEDVQNNIEKQYKLLINTKSDSLDQRIVALTEFNEKKTEENDVLFEELRDILEK